LGCGEVVVSSQHILKVLNKKDAIANKQYGTLLYMTTGQQPALFIV